MARGIVFGALSGSDSGTPSRHATDKAQNYIIRLCIADNLLTSTSFEEQVQEFKTYM